MSGTIVIKPLQAKLTRDVDVLSKMDPYCLVMIGNQKVHGTVCKSGGKTPKWEESITVRRNNEPFLYIEVKDKDTFSSDEIIGVCQINLDELSSQSVTARWQPLFYNQKPAGDLLVELVYTADQTAPPLNLHQGSVQPHITAPSGQPLEMYAAPGQTIISTNVGPIVHEAISSQTTATTVTTGTTISGHEHTHHEKESHPGHGHPHGHEHGHHNSHHAQGTGHDYVHPHLAGVELGKFLSMKNKFNQSNRQN